MSCATLVNQTPKKLRKPNLLQFEKRVLNCEILISLKINYLLKIS